MGDAFGHRTFLVLTLQEIPGEVGGYRGWMERPRHFTTSDGVSFTHVSHESTRETIQSGRLRGDALMLTVQSSSEAQETKEYTARLQDNDHLEVRAKDVPIKPFLMVRARGGAKPATDWEDAKTYPDWTVAASSAAMQRLFEEDQAARQPGTKMDWAVLSKKDAERRAATRKLLDAGDLHTGEDFGKAAFLFQHGDGPEDYLLAHTLAMVAVSRGDQGSIWSAAATLDRYLQSEKRPQIFGTQFLTHGREPTTQEPYDRSVISNGLRVDLSVPSQAMQEQQRKQYDLDRGVKAIR